MDQRTTRDTIRDVIKALADDVKIIEKLEAHSKNNEETEAIRSVVGVRNWLMTELAAVMGKIDKGEITEAVKDKVWLQTKQFERGHSQAVASMRPTAQVYPLPDINKDKPQEGK